MPTIFTHTAVPLALGIGLGNATISRRLVVAGMAASMIPDADVIGFSLNVAHGSVWGHRGFTHSLTFAAALALTGACFFRQLQTRFHTAFLFLFLATTSHGILDAFTNGGSGVAFMWPWSDERYRAPISVIEVSPIGLRFFSPRGVTVLTSELLWVWLPCMMFAVTLLAFRKRSH